MNQGKKINSTDKASEDNYAGKAFGPEGVDTAPGEEVAGTTKNVVADTQKGKGKEDGDPSIAEDQPVGE